MAVATRSSSSRPRRPGRPRALYLDLLPAELRDLIARHVCAGRRTSSALSLAQTTRAQQAAVVSALSHSLTVHRSPADVPALLPWLPVFQHAGLRQLSITSAFEQLPTRLRTGVLRLLAAPTLRSAKVPDHPRILRALARGAALQDLTVLLLEGGAWPMDASRLLLRTLAAHPLRSLDMHCSAPWESECPLHLLERLIGTRHSLACSCPALEEFHAASCVHAGDPYWAILRSLASIRRVTIQRSPPADCVDYLRGVRSVEICGVRRGATLAAQLGAAVTSVQDVQVASADEVELLGACTRLRTMQVTLLAGGLETELGRVCGRLWRLQTVRLRWDRGRETWRKMRFVSARNPQAVRLLYLPRYAAAARGGVAQLAAAAAGLCELELRAVRVGVGEVERVLEVLGARLTRLGVPFHDQGESTGERFKRLTSAIVRCNPRLVEVSAGGDRVSSMMHIDEIAEAECDEVQAAALRSGRALVRQVRKTVRERLPRLSGGVESWVEAVLWIPGEEMES